MIQLRKRTKAFVKRLATSIAKPAVKRYLQKDRSYRFNDLHLKVFAGVFHPGFFFSTKIFAAWLQQQNISGRKLLELGAGSGLISLVAVRKGALVTASDINQKAVANVKLNAALNELEIRTIHSDLFDRLVDDVFDLVIINPPYFPKTPADDYEKAWYCGEDYNYFKTLFLQLQTRSTKEEHYMILCDICNIPLIKQIAAEFNLQLQAVHVKKNIWETNYIFKIERISEP